jgi:crotonobetainyl-CoA:carnitine CoA-transferase CaiB-like acyl-CoA transferase
MLASLIRKSDVVMDNFRPGVMDKIGFGYSHFTGNDHPIVAPYGIFRATNGDLAIAPSNDQVYEKLITALELNHLKDHPDFTTNDQRMINREKINAVIQEKIGTQSCAF